MFVLMIVKNEVARTGLLNPSTRLHSESSWDKKFLIIVKLFI